MKRSKKMAKVICSLIIVGVLFTCKNSKNETDYNNSDTKEDIQNPTNRVMLSSEIVWEKLNPARGDQSPQAGTIWGDRQGTIATGFLAKFVDGFSSPPHIHNVTYRAVVIEGLIHNDDPNAEAMWMKPGSFWTQPAGEAHITSAKGGTNIAYVEIDYGPYLVKPINQGFDNGESPVNIEASNIQWLNSNQTRWIHPETKAEMSFLWDHKQMKGLKGVFVKLPPGFNGYLKSDSNTFHAVVIRGKTNYKMPKTEAIKQLDAGSYFTSVGKSVHTIFNSDEGTAVFYIRTDGKIKIEPIS